MIKKQSLAKNYLYQFLYQGLILVIPLILSPYLTRTLQETALGTYAYINSIAYYFVIAANLGIGIHGKRSISRCCDDELKLRKTFWSLFTLHAIISAIVAAIYILFIALFIKENINIYVIELAYVLSALFDITWLFYGLENFKSVVIRNTIVKAGECIFIFLCVKKASDLWVYTMIMAGGILLGQMVMLPRAIKIVKPIKFGFQDVKPHMKPLLVFSLALIASTLYTVSNKTLLGILSTKENVAFYEYSNKIIGIPRTFIGIIGSVMLPRACRLANSGSTSEQKKFMQYSFLITAFIGMGSSFGLLAISKPLAIFYYGTSFEICGDIIAAMSPLICIVGIGDVIRQQCMIPNGMDKHFNLCILFNAIINVILCVLLIPKLGVYGVVIGTTAAEMFGLLYQLFACRSFIRLRDMIKPILSVGIIGLLMYLILVCIQNILPTNVTGLIIAAFVGAMFYTVLFGIYLLVFEQDITRLIKRRYLYRK